MSTESIGGMVFVKAEEIGSFVFTFTLVMNFPFGDLRLLYSFRKQLLCLLALPFFALSAHSQNNLEGAQKYFEQGNFALALPTLLAAEASYAGDADLTMRIATCYYHLRMPREAVQYYQKIGVYLNRFPQELAKYADALVMDGNYSEAIEVYKHLQPDLPVLAATKVKCLQDALKARTLRSDYLVSPIEGNSRYSEGSVTFYQDQVLLGAQVHPSADFNKSPFRNQLFGAELDHDGNIPVLRHPGFTIDEAARFVNVRAMPGRKTLVLTDLDLPFYGTVFRPGMAHTNILFQDFNAENEPYPLRPFPYNDVSFSNGQAAFSTDGNIMYFCSDRPGGFGGFDIYLCHRRGNSWAEPINLGPVINTDGNEIAPFVFDNTMYFSSDVCGFGGYDIFKSTMDNKEYSQPENLGWGINSTRDDYGLLYDATRNVGFLISNRPESAGADDIFSYHLRAKILNIQVLDAADNSYLAGTIIDFSRCDDPYRTCDIEGKCNYFVYEGMNCFVTISKTGYTESAFYINYDSIQGATKSLKIFLVRTGRFAVGQLISPDYTPLLHVRIQVINQLDGEIQETYSDHDGRFAVSLRSGVTYILKYSKEGYELLNRRVDGDEVKDSTDLGQTILLAKESRNMVDITPMPVQAQMTPIEVYEEENALLDSSAVTVIPESTMIYGYVIQLAASNLPFKSLKYFEQKLPGLGQIYVKQQDGYYKVKLGYFKTEKLALANLDKVRSSGVPDAFISRDAFPEAYLQLKEPLKESILMLQDSNLTYKVNITSFMGEELPDLTTVRQLGQIEVLQLGEWKTILLGDFHSINDAQVAMDIAIKAGFEKAHVVVMQGDNIMRIDLGY